MVIDKNTGMPELPNKRLYWKIGSAFTGGYDLRVSLKYKVFHLIPITLSSALSSPYEGLVRDAAQEVLASHQNEVRDLRNRKRYRKERNALKGVYPPKKIGDDRR